MADIAFAPLALVPEGWQVLVKIRRFALAVDRAHGAYGAGWEVRGGIAVLVVSHGVGPRDVLAALCGAREKFADALGVAAGFVANLKTGEFCVFRDLFGVIPVMSARVGADCVWTTSPGFYARVGAEKALDRAWFYRFLTRAGTASRGDMRLDCARVYPGEAQFYVKDDAGAFVDGVCRQLECGDRPAPEKGADGLERPDLGAFKCQSEIYWRRCRYEPCEASEATLVSKFRGLFLDAVSRVPGGDPCFTLSGGLDSSGILSAWLRCHVAPHADAVSLVSRRYPSCDESRELDILESRFPLRLLRVEMDGTPLLEDFEIYRTGCGYGPMVAPGIELMLAAYHGVEKRWGARTIVTGYGGNWLVRARREAVWRALAAHGDWRALAGEARALDILSARRMIRRMAGQWKGGALRRIWRGIRARWGRNSAYGIAWRNGAPSWINPQIFWQYPVFPQDDACGLSHGAERAWLPLSEHWEWTMRALDVVARVTPHRFCDPLLDRALYDFCATVPPRLMLKNGDARHLYKRMLQPFLPPEIIVHPKVQHFDDCIMDGLRRKDALVRGIISSIPADFVSHGAFEAAWHAFVQSPHDWDLGALWRAVALGIWGLGFNS